MSDPITIIVFGFGLIVGSFLNVCIVRLPKEKSIVFPGSHCPNCKTPIQWYQNIPVFSYLFLRGKCSSCGSKISVRYPIVELLTGIGFVCFYNIFGLEMVLLPYLVFLSGLIIATFVDLEHRIIPDEISLGGMLAGIFISAFVVNLHDIDSATLIMGQYLVRIIALLYIVWHLVYFLLKKIKIKEEMPEFLTIAAMIILEYVFGSLAIKTRGTQWDHFYPHFASLDAALIGALVGGGVIYGMAILGDVIFRKESMGGGDIKLMAMVGAFIGWKMSILGFFLAPFFGLIYGVIEKIRTKDSAIAYGPFLAIGSLISLFYYHEIMEYVMGHKLLF